MFHAVSENLEARRDGPARPYRMLDRFVVVGLDSVHRWQAVVLRDLNITILRLKTTPLFLILKITPLLLAHGPKYQLVSHHAPVCAVRVSVHKPRSCRHGVCALIIRGRK